MSEFEFSPAVLPAYAFNYHSYMARGLSKAQAKRAAAKARAERVVLSSVYQVNINEVLAPPPFGKGLWFSCKRRDKEPIVDRSVLSQILWALRPDSWAVELFPKSARVVDTANQYHLYVFEGICFSLLGEESEQAQVEPGVCLSELILPTTEDEAPVRLKVLSFGPGQSGRGDWRWLQQRKEALVGDLEACQVHLQRGIPNRLEHSLLILPDPDMAYPFGFSAGLRGGAADAEKWGAKQREF